MSQSHQVPLGFELLHDADQTLPEAAAVFDLAEGGAAIALRGAYSARPFFGRSLRVIFSFTLKDPRRNKWRVFTMWMGTYFCAGP